MKLKKKLEIPTKAPFSSYFRRKTDQQKSQTSTEVQNMTKNSPIVEPVQNSSILELY